MKAKLAKKKTRARTAERVAVITAQPNWGKSAPAFTGCWWLTDSTRACYDELGTGADFFDARERLRVRLAERGVMLCEVVDVAFVADADVRKAATE